jgi:thioredoxin reductase
MSERSHAKLPVAVIGAGPVGLAAAAHLAIRGEPFLLLEGGCDAGHTIAQWGHVRVFSPWRYNIDGAARQLLEEAGWIAPNDDELPLGREIVEQYLAPLATSPRIAASTRFNAKVIAVGRKNYDKVRTKGRTQQPFEIRLADGEVIEARAVIDASGTWLSPNPLGAGGYPVEGEASAAARIVYGIPDVLGRDRVRYAGQRVLVVGAGHSAVNAVLDLLAFKRADERVEIVWALRRENLDVVFGGGAADGLPARGALGRNARRAVEAGDVQVLTPFRIERIAVAGAAVAVHGSLHGRRHAVEVDQIIVATGSRPDFGPLREIRLNLDPWLECSAALGPLIDPNEHSCGTVRAHGFKELAHPEHDFYVIGAKSYGRAPTFLMATGFEQARSVVAALTGDLEAASRVELDLPQTGVCNVTPNLGTSRAAVGVAGETASGCCGGSVPEPADACCVKDAKAKAAGESGCGCSSKQAPALEVTKRVEKAAPVACCR